MRAELFAAQTSVAQVKDTCDLYSHEYLMKCLESERPDDAVLSEESKDESAETIARRLSSRRVWIVDPLDGTREFGEGRDDWAVHVALVIDGVPAVGAVAVPDLHVTYSTVSPAVVPSDSSAVVVASRTRPPLWAESAAAAVGASVQPMGSAGAKAMAVIRGDAVAYVHAGGMSEWDSCAPVAVALGSGLWCSDLSGQPLQFNTPSQRTNELVICRDGVQAAILSEANEFH